TTLTSCALLERKSSILLWTAEDFKTIQPGVEATPDSKQAASTTQSAAIAPDFEDLVHEEHPLGKHSPCFEYKNEQVYKARFLNQKFKVFQTPGSQDYLKRVANIPRYNVKSASHAPHIINASLDDITQTLEIDKPIVSLIQCEDDLFLCLGKVSNLNYDSKPVKQISMDMLLDPMVQVSYQILFLKRTTTEDNPNQANDWKSLPK
ncbi:hypothetical protein C0991_005550, partial [Blastosporella zonata]